MLILIGMLMLMPGVSEVDPSVVSEGSSPDTAVVSVVGTLWVSVGVSWVSEVG